LLLNLAKVRKFVFYRNKFSNIECRLKSVNLLQI
jgi:hypothetical protein